MTIAALETAIKKALTDAATAKQLKIHIDAYGGQLDEAKLEAIAQSCPAVWVVISGLTLKRKMNVGGEYEVTASVLCASNSLDDDMARQGGRGGRHIGAYNLINFVYSALSAFHGHDATGQPILSQPLKATGINNLFNAKTRRNYLAVYAIPFTGRLIWLPDEPIDANLDDFTDIQSHSTPADAVNGGIDTPNIETAIAQKETP